MMNMIYYRQIEDEDCRAEEVEAQALERPRIIPNRELSNAQGQVLARNRRVPFRGSMYISFFLSHIEESLMSLIRKSPRFLHCGITGALSRWMYVYTNALPY